ncbi:SOS response-associated peptidase family protein [Leptospira brenneri]|uniref:Abasic site processing protein n=1 Tax=Leptospira brenneri TaxID=2023182 RepID=A0A2M9XWR1_9LEPT|nr:SOS response-associated peptidase family protein [Leptospira brenneri]PJZ43744.1 DUF159 family protein [Leptospira brenneri]TGK94034.1 DUF159 family protein [Leptospira brenneri]
MSNLFINRLISIEDHSNRWEDFAFQEKNYKEAYQKHNLTGLPIKPNDHFWYLRQLNNKTFLSFGSWGTKQTFADGGLITTAQSERIFTSSFWKSYSTNRCLIPVFAYFEWQMQQTGKKHKFKIEFIDKETYFAGLWGSGPNDSTWVTIITQVANEKTAEIHNYGDNKHRQPVVIRRENQDQWIDSKINEEKKIKSLITQFQPEEITTEDQDSEPTLFS